MWPAFYTAVYFLKSLLCFFESGLHVPTLGSQSQCWFMQRIKWSSSPVFPLWCFYHTLWFMVTHFLQFLWPERWGGTFLEKKGNRRRRRCRKAEKICPYGSIILSSMANSIGNKIFLPLGENHIKILSINSCTHLKASYLFKSI